MVAALRKSILAYGMLMLIFAVLLPPLPRGKHRPIAPASSRPTVTPATPPPQPQDRKDGSSAAKAMAIAAAAMQGVTCMMMMQQAQKDGSTMEMMMAMQECAQAAQSAANAARTITPRKELRTTRPNKHRCNFPRSIPMQRTTRATKMFWQAFSDPRAHLPTRLDLGSPDLASNSSDISPSPDRTPAEGHPQAPVGPEAPKPKPLPTIDKAKLGYDGVAIFRKMAPPPTSPFYPPMAGGGKI